MLGAPLRSLATRSSTSAIGLSANLASDPLSLNNFTFNRASTARDTDAAGVVSSFSADAARAPSTRGLLLENSAQNLLVNPLAVGGEVSGNAPATWGFSASDTSLVVTASAVFLGQTTINGVVCQLVRLSTNGVALATSLVTRLGFGNVAATIVNGLSFSAYISVVGGSLTNITSIQMRVPNATASVFTVPVDSTQVRHGRTFAFTADQAAVPAQLQINGTVGQPIDVTLAIGLPMVEASQIVTSPVAPPAGTQGVSSRSPDIMTLTASNFAAIFGVGAPQGWVIADVVMDSNSNPMIREIIQIDNGTDQNKIEMRPNVSGTSALAVTNVGGAQTTTPVQAIPAYGAVARWGMRWNSSTGTVSLSVNGAAVQSYTPGVLGAFTTLRIGCGINTGAALNGRVLRVWAGKSAPGDSPFQAACSLSGNPSNLG